MGAVLGSLSEIRELKTEITGLRTDLKRFVERANQQHVDAVLGGLKKNYGELFTKSEIDTAGENLTNRMVRNCKMRDQCFEAFMGFLQGTAQHIKDGSVSEEVIESCREQMKELRKKGQSGRCDTCFTEVSRLFEKQVDLMQSLGIYQKSAALRENLPAIPEQAIVREILEPVASVQRFQILRALAVQTRTFSDISQITGLRGGNLLFHIRKMADAGMILQRHERGDYTITEKGFKTLTAVSELAGDLIPQQEETVPAGTGGR
ncbi:MAG: winged helix-turn-helix domain-containing protein [Methanoregulaceae archaeon]